MGRQNWEFLWCYQSTNRQNTEEENVGTTPPVESLKRNVTIIHSFWFQNKTEGARRTGGADPFWAPLTARTSSVVSFNDSEKLLASLN